MKTKEFIESCFLAGWQERSFDSLCSLRIRILIGCEERSFVAMLLRTDSLIGTLVNHNAPHPPVFWKCCI
jgi:hypothetical protein